MPVKTVTAKAMGDASAPAEPILTKAKSAGRAKPARATKPPVPETTAEVVPEPEAEAAKVVAPSAKPAIAKAEVAAMLVKVGAVTGRNIRVQQHQARRQADHRVVLIHSAAAGAAGVPGCVPCAPAGKPGAPGPRPAGAAAG